LLVEQLAVEFLEVEILQEESAAEVTMVLLLEMVQTEQAAELAKERAVLVW
jgi:hypothetical protein